MARMTLYTWDAMGQGYPYGNYELTTLPGCSAVCVSHGLFFYEDQRGKGLSDSAMKDRINEAYELGYDLMVCTVLEENDKEIHTLIKNGWQQAHSFKSRNSLKRVRVYTRSTEI